MKKITIMRHLNSLKDQLIIIVFISIVVVFFPIPDKLQIWIFAFSISVLPTLIIHLSYSWVNRGVAVSFSENILILKKKGIVKEIDLARALNIDCYLTNNLRYGNTPFLPWENYFYIKVLDSNGEIFITSLLLDVKELKAMKNINFHTDWFPIVIK